MIRPELDLYVDISQPPGPRRYADLPPPGTWA